MIEAEILTGADETLSFLRETSRTDSYVLALLAECSHLLTILSLSLSHPPRPPLFPNRPSTDVTVRSALGKSHFSQRVPRLACRVSLGGMNMENGAGRGGAGGALLFAHRGAQTLRKSSPTPPCRHRRVRRNSWLFLRAEKVRSATSI